MPQITRQQDCSSKVPLPFKCHQKYRASVTIRITVHVTIQVHCSQLQVDLILVSSHLFCKPKSNLFSSFPQLLIDPKSKILLTLILPQAHVDKFPNMSYVTVVSEGRRERERDCEGHALFAEKRKVEGMWVDGRNYFPPFCCNFHSSIDQQFSVALNILYTETNGA